MLGNDPHAECRQILTPMPTLIEEMSLASFALEKELMWLLRLLSSMRRN